MIRSSKTMFALLTVSVLFSTPLLIRAGEPTEQLSATVNTLSSMLASAPSGAISGRELPDRVRRVIFSRFDFGEMSRRSLGSHWEGLTQEQRGEFVEVFTGLLLESYRRTLHANTGKQVSFEREELEGDQARVGTKVAMEKGEFLTVDYRLHLLGSDWKVYDIVVDNISIVNNYRSQFDRVLAVSSFQELVRRLKERQA